MSKPVFALVGEDSFLQLQKLAEIRSQLPADVQVIDVEGERAELSDVLDELRSFAMFGSGKLVVVRDADEFISKFREQLEDYLAKPSDSGTLVLRCNSLPKNTRVARLIVKSGAVFECEAPKAHQLPGWIVARGRAAHGIVITPDAATLLADLIGADLGRLDSELAKLALQVDGGRVSPGDIAGNVAFQREQEMWQMTDELTAGRPAEAIRRWRHLVHLDPSTEYRAVTWLTMWLERLTRATAMKRAGRNPFDIAKELRIWPAEQVNVLLGTASKLGADGLRRAVDLLADLDRKSKTGVGNAAGNVEQFILSLASGSR